MKETTCAARLSEDAYNNLVAAKAALLANPKGSPGHDAAKATHSNADSTLAIELLAFAKRVIYVEFGDSINQFDAESIIEDAGTWVWQQLCRPESIGNGNGGFKRDSSLATWAWKVVRNYTNDQIVAARKLLTEPNETFLAETMIDRVPNGYRYAAQDEHIDSLNDAEKAVFIGKSNGLTGHEIAKQQGVSDGTIDNDWKKTQQKLRRRRNICRRSERKSKYKDAIL